MRGVPAAIVEGDNIQHFTGSWVAKQRAAQEKQRRDNDRRYQQNDYRQNRERSNSQGRANMANNDTEDTPLKRYQKANNIPDSEIVQTIPKWILESSFEAGVFKEEPAFLSGVTFRQPDT